MKKTDGLTRAIGILLFTAMLCYMGFAVARRLTDTTRTATAAEATLTLSADMTGLVLRQEQPICSDNEYIDITAGEGEKLSAGESLATVYRSAEALERAVELRTLAEEIEQLKQEQGAAETADVSAVHDTLDKLAACVQLGDTSGAARAAREAEQMLWGEEKTDSGEDYLRTLERRYDSLLPTTERESETITASEAGLFSRVVDGWEDLGPDNAAILTPASLRGLMDRGAQPADGAIGKLVSGFRWYYAALVSEADSENMQVGDRVKLRFERYCSRALEAEILSVSEVTGGERAVLFVLDEAMAELLSARQTAAELVGESYRGLRVPEGGLYRYWAGYVSAEEAQSLYLGQTVWLKKGGWTAECVLAELGEDEPGENGDRCQVILCWPWQEDNAPPETENAALVTGDNGAGYFAADYYGPEEQADCLCVFTMTARRAERRKVTLVYAGEDYFLVSGQGSNALRAGSEIILQAENLYTGRVFN